MPSRNREIWERPPDLPETHYVDAAAYANPDSYTHTAANPDADADAGASAYG